MSFDEGRSLLEMEDQISTKEDVISRMSTEERQYNSVRSMRPISQLIFYTRITDCSPCLPLAAPQSYD